jgi:hypothetical protein
MTARKILVIADLNCFEKKNQIYSEKLFSQNNLKIVSGEIFFVFLISIEDFIQSNSVKLVFS